MKRLNFAEILIEQKLINQTQLYEAIEKQKQTKQTLGQILLDMKVISEREMLVTLAQELSFEYIENPSSVMDISVKEMVGFDFASSKKILPLHIRDGRLVFATSDPLDFITMEDLGMITGFDTQAVISPYATIQQGLAVMYSETDDIEDEALVLNTEDTDLLQRVESAPVVKMVNALIDSAYNVNASDIHIEPGQDATRIRFRVDGTLSEHMVLKKELHELVTTRIKIVSGMNIAEKRKPQDGAIRHTSEFLELDLRVSSIPTPLGEKIVMRLLGADQNISYSLDSIEINEDIKDKLRAISQVPNGILLLTGPTGSGKTTTLYSLLNEISTPEVSVVTVEDPVEKQFEGITQVQINERAGLTFAAGLRSILRQDPDVIMLGEIRDAETATIAIRAAITGHFVLSTLHTNDALSSVVRLIDMGVAPYMVASSLKAVIAQRLVKKICPKCSEVHELANEDKLLFQDIELKQASVGKGCERCSHSGYTGRVAVFEIVFIDEVLENMISENASMNKLKEYVASQGTKFLRDDVIRLIQEGKTSITEAKKILFSVS
ncbi:MAG: type II/IV secretion system protein [Erysipelothrix sp.]|nr:type II/IV secretion system protein [Erysipelothrix sp.]